MSIPVMSQVWRTHLPLRGKFVLLAMADFADKFGRKVFPTVGTICKKTSMSESAVHRALHELRGKGFLIETKKARYGRGTEYMIPSSAPQGSPNPPKRVPKPAPERPVDGRADGSTSGTSGVPPAGPNPPMNHQEYINTTSPVVPKKRKKRNNGKISTKERKLLDTNQDVMSWMWRMAGEAGKRWKSRGPERKGPTAEMEPAIRWQEGNRGQAGFHRGWLAFLRSSEADSARFPYSAFLKSLGNGSRFQSTNASNEHNPRANGTNARAVGTNPRATGSNPRAVGTNPRQMSAQARACYAHAAESFKKIRGHMPTSWDGTDAEALENLLCKGITPEKFAEAWSSNFADSTDPFVRNQGMRLRYFCRNYDRFEEKQLSRAEQMRLRGERVLQALLAKRRENL